MLSLATRARALARNDFARHGLIVFVAMMSQNVLGYAYHFAISRRIGVEQYGVLSALNAGLMIGGVVGAIGTTVVVKYAAEFRATGDRAKLAALARKLSIYCPLAFAVATIVLLVAARPVAGYLRITNVLAVSFAMVIVGFQFATPALRGIFQGVEDFVQFALAVVIESVGKAAVGIGLVYAGFGVNGAIFGWAAGSCIAFFYTLVALRLRFGGVERAPLLIDVRRLANTMSSVAVATLLITVLSYSDVIVVKHFADPTTAGLYGALSLSGKILLFFVAFVPTVVLPKATRQAMSGESTVGVFVQALAVSVAMSGAGLVVYFFFPLRIVTALAGPSFAAAAPYVFGYGLATVLLAGLNVVVSYKIGIHRFDFVVPLALCVVGEIAGISIYHASLSQVILVLVAGNGLALLGCAYRVTAPLASRVRTPEASASDAA